MQLKYNGSKQPTVGMELEMRILDKKTLGVKNCSSIIFSSIKSELREHIHKELLQSMFEIVTPVCSSVDEAVNFIDMTMKEVASIGDRHGFYISALATHPFERKEDSEIVHDIRYEEFKDEFQILIKNFLISGLHIHVGVDSQNSAIRAYNSVVNYLPLFLALSANSPFFHSEDTGLRSYRTKIFDDLPRAGVPEYFNSYEEYTKLYNQLYSTSTIKKSKDIWWDVRISPKFGTLELRVCDAFYSKERLKFIGLFYQALVVYSNVKEFHREFHQINLQNKWSATRYGMDGYFIENGKRTTIRKKIDNLLNKMSQDGIFQKLGTQDEIDSLRYIVDRPSLSRRLKDIYRDTKDFKEVIKHQIVGLL
jgi:carboxylate-amine ligase